MLRIAAATVLVLALQAAPPAAAAQDPSQKPPAGVSAPSFDGTEDIPVSYPRIRAALKRKPLFDTPTIQEGTRFKVQIQQYQFDVPDFASTFRIPKQPVPFGGLYHNEMLMMMTPSSVRGSTPYNNAELLTVMATSFAQAFAARAVTAGVRQIRQALRNAEEERVYRQVLRELAQIEENRKRREEEEKRQQ
jgi:hypothetical protein